MPLFRRAAFVVALVALAAGTLRSQQTQQQQSVPRPAGRDVPPPGTAGAAPARPPLPPLSPDAQRLFDQLKQNQTSIIEQLRFLQQSYRDAGHAEDAAAIAAHVRQLQQRLPPVTASVTAELVNEGLPTRDEPVRMSMFRHLPGQILTFAIRGREDQPVWGTTTYTDDSGLESAAVHAGLMRAGQTGIVKVRVLPGQDKYDATSANGVRSNEYSRADGSYRFTGVTVTMPSRSSSLSSYRDLVGHSITLPVVGTTSGSVWGSDVYTDDSSVAAAAVHAGALSVGEFGFVKVTLMPGQSRYEGSMRNGVTSQTYEIFDGSFRVEPAPQPWVVQLPGGEDASRLVPMGTLRGKTDLSFMVQVKGTTSGTVWGSGTYTDDSSISAAAVHAGLLKVDEIGMVRVIIMPGLDKYLPTEANGIKSQPYEKWEGSFRLERVR
jgi:hypothetical protein